MASEMTKTRRSERVRDSHTQEPDPGDESPLDRHFVDARQRRNANLYDAVAGRVTTTASLLDSSTDASRGIKSSGGIYRLRGSTLAPEEVLFQRRGAPQRYAEKDIYFSPEASAVTDANNGDGSGSGSGSSSSNRLPDSDLLQAVHAYASHFYEAVGRGAVGSRHRDAGRDPACFVGSRLVDERSMDETALIAFGILLEEASREVLGRRGDLVFTEGLETATEHGGMGSGDGREPSSTASYGGRGRPARSREASLGVSDGETFWRRSYPKRRKPNQSDMGGD